MSTTTTRPFLNVVKTVTHVYMSIKIKLSFFALWAEKCFHRATSTLKLLLQDSIEIVQTLQGQITFSSVEALKVMVFLESSNMPKVDFCDLTLLMAKVDTNVQVSPSNFFSKEEISKNNEWDTFLTHPECGMNNYCR